MTLAKCRECLAKQNVAAPLENQLAPQHQRGWTARGLWFAVGRVFFTAIVRSKHRVLALDDVAARMIFLRTLRSGLLMLGDVQSNVCFSCPEHLNFVYVSLFDYSAMYSTQISAHVP